MDRIQVIFLYDSYKILSTSQQQQIVDIVRASYTTTFEQDHSVDVALVNGFSDTNPNDIILAIKRQNTIINEADYRTRFSELVRSRLAESGLFSYTGYRGRVGWKDGLISLPDSPIEKKTPAKPEAPAGEAMGKKSPEKFDYETRALMYQATEPEYTFDSLCVPEIVKTQILSALDRIKYEREVFEEWGLKVIMPNPICALSFYGPPGTGKSLAADAIASYLGKRIIRTSYADIENKYVGEGPKNVSAVFLAAENQDAVLLIDEADSLLSKRLVNVQEASGQAINSMRSQLLISLEHFHGIVVFTTNMIVNYDAAFISRLINVEFTLPDTDMRVEIWKKHLLPRSNGKYQMSIPLDQDVDFDLLAASFDLSGRDIRGAAVDACVMGYKKYGYVNMECLMSAAKSTQEKSRAALSANDHTKISFTSEEKSFLAKKMQEKIDAKKVQDTPASSEVQQ